MSRRPPPRLPLLARRLVEILPCVIVLLAPFGTSSAEAQSAGNGIRIGEGRLHPTFDLELRYDSSAGFFSSSADPGAPPELSPEAISHLRPGLRFELPASRFTLAALARADYVYFTGLVTPGSERSSRLEGDAEARLVFDPTGPFSAELLNRFAVSDRTQNAALGLGVISLFDETRASITVKPGGGALELTPSAAFSLERFQVATSLSALDCQDLTCAPDSLWRMNYQDAQGGLEGRWRFFPKTAFAVDGVFQHRWYRDPTQPTASLARLSAGVVGLVSSKVSAVAKLGYGHDFGASAVGSLIAQLDATYRITDTSHVKAGYARLLSPVPVFGTYRDDRVFAETRLVFGGKLNLRGAVSYDRLRFFAGGARTDHLVTVNVSPEYDFGDWLQLAAGYALGVRASEGSTSSATNFARNELYVRMSLLY